MNTFLWILQVFLAISFGYSGFMKATKKRAYLVRIGQTGIAHLSYPVIRFIGISELFGMIGILLPWWLTILPVLTPVTAVCFAIIMLLAAPIHYKRKEMKAVGINTFFFIISVAVAYLRFAQL